ncbi:hypothetical protein JTE90_007857 [Oedothorax gibbosus]|uniref:Uncharacterized protein n=1 Tax=Oedothorax gibbosus TaxID=931172 RepID=A0AAV6VKN6_9ARAC|nr:hypothetical protein JTE90_007857 [Oedothorax gibbosus]
MKTERCTNVRRRKFPRTPDVRRRKIPRTPNVRRRKIPRTPQVDLALKGEGNQSHLGYERLIKKRMIQIIWEAAPNSVDQRANCNGPRFTQDLER